MGINLSRGVKIPVGRAAFPDRDALRNSSIWPMEGNAGPWAVANPMGGTDPDFASVELLMQGEAFADASNAARTITGNGVMTAGSVTGKFGNAYDIPGAVGDFYTVSGNLELPGDFTIEMWAVVPSGGDRSLYVISNVAGTSFLAINYDKSLTKFNIYLNTGTPGFTPTATLDGTFRHIALNRTGSTVKFFLEGVELFSTTNSATLGYTGTPAFHRGGGGASAPQTFDDLRITKGVGRYPAAFTPPTAEFPTS